MCKLALQEVHNVALSGLDLDASCFLACPVNLFQEFGMSLTLPRWTLDIAGCRCGLTQAALGSIASRTSG